MRISVLATYVAENYGFGVWRERSQQVFLARDVVQNGVQKGKVYEVEVVENPKDVTGNTPWLAAHLYDDEQEEVIEHIAPQVDLDNYDIDFDETDEVFAFEQENTPETATFREDIYALLINKRIMSSRQIINAMHEKYSSDNFKRYTISNCLHTLFRNGLIVKCNLYMHADKRASNTYWAKNPTDIKDALATYG